MEAINALLEDKGSEDSLRRANDCILQGLWQNTSFSQKIKDSDSAAIKFLQVASKVDLAAISPSQSDEARVSFCFAGLRLTFSSSSPCSKTCVTPSIQPYSVSSPTSSLIDKSNIRHCYASTITSSISLRLSKPPTPQSLLSSTISGTIVDFSGNLSSHSMLLMKQSRSCSTSSQHLSRMHIVSKTRPGFTGW